MDGPANRWHFSHVYALHSGLNTMKGGKERPISLWMNRQRARRRRKSLNQDNEYTMRVSCIVLHKISHSVSIRLPVNIWPPLVFSLSLSTLAVYLSIFYYLTVRRTNSFHLVLAFVLSFLFSSLSSVTMYPSYNDFLLCTLSSHISLTVTRKAKVRPNFPLYTRVHKLRTSHCTRTVHVHISPLPVWKKRTDSPVQVRMQLRVSEEKARDTHTVREEKRTKERVNSLVLLLSQSASGLLILRYVHHLCSHFTRALAREQTYTLFSSLFLPLNMRLKVFSFLLTSKLTTDGMRRSHLFTLFTSSLLMLLAISWYINRHPLEEDVFYTYRTFTLHTFTVWIVNCVSRLLVSSFYYTFSLLRLYNNWLVLHHIQLEIKFKSVWLYNNRTR